MAIKHRNLNHILQLQQLYKYTLQKYFISCYYFKINITIDRLNEIVYRRSNYMTLEISH